MTQIADLSDAPLYVPAATPLCIRARKVTAVLYREDGAYFALGDGGDLHAVPLCQKPPRAGDFLVEDDSGEQFFMPGGKLDEFYRPDRVEGAEGEHEDDEDVTLIELGELNDRVTLADIKASIASASYHRLDGTLTVCVLTLDNGFTVTGESYCRDPEEFDEAAGRQTAYYRAIDKCWPLHGFLLAEMRYLKRLADGTACERA